MARKKQEIALMREIESQEEWEDVMTKEGLWVVDVYQEWSGPCDAMVSNFRRIKNELGDDLLHFAMAKSDNIETLEKYRGSCEPCFLFFAAGVLVSYVHGANAPLILRTLTEQLAQEHKVQDGSAERKEVKDPFVAAREAAEDQKDEEEEDEDTGVPRRKVSTYPQDYEEVEQGFTVAIIKPNVVAEGKVDDILAEMKACGIEVMAQEERQLTEEEAREFYSHLKDEEYFDDLVGFMASGPSHVLVLTKGQEDDSIIKDWREMLGPPTVEDAKETAPECLRAKYGQAGLMNALHGSDSKETAARELAFFFPSMNTPTMQKKKKEIQRTLALIRPDAFASNRDAILERIKEAGFQIALQREVMLTKEQAEEFYKEHAGQPYYEELTNRMSSGPLLALGLAREDAVENWRGMLGPTDVEEAKTSAPDSLRAQFAVGDVPINQLHGSDSVEAAQKELNFFFPVEQTVAMIKPDAIGTKDAIIDKIHQAGFRIAARKETTITREIAESFYEDQKDKDYFNDLVEHMVSGPTMFMVLSRESAIDCWRQEIGPTDPAQAKEEAPNSLRAQFGTDVLKNAVHGASSQDEANKKIQTVFGSLDFNADEEIQKAPEEEAVSGSPVPGAADIAPEYRDQGQAEGEGQSEDKPAEGEGEAAEKSGETEQTEKTEETKKTDEEEKIKGAVEEKPSEQTADSEAKDDSAGEAAQKSAAEDQGAPSQQETKGDDAGDKGEEAKKEEATEQAKAEETKAETPAAEEAKDDTPAAGETKDDTPAAGETKDDTPQAGETKDDTPQAGETKDDTPQAGETKDDTPQAGETKDDAPATGEAKDDTPQAGEAKDSKPEEQKEGEAEKPKEEDNKGEQKEGSAETKKEGE